MDEARARAAQAASDMRDAMESMPEAASKLSECGVDVDNFAQKLVDAGVSTGQLSAVGTENLSRMAEEFDGDVDRMVGAIEVYNSVPLVDKDGTVNVDDAKLADAQGNVYTWNGTALVDKDGNAAVDGTSVVDSTKKVWEWNGTVLKSKEGNATVLGNVVTGDAQSAIDNTDASIRNLADSKTSTVNVDGNYSSAATTIWDLVGAIASLGSKTIEVVTNKITNVIGSGNAAGGIRLNAAGGYRMHAAGAIATRAVPLDIVGEAGAEAIVPLTNERYSKPFAEQIARQMQEAAGKGGVTVNVYARSEAAQDIALAVRREIESLSATGVM